MKITTPSPLYIVIASAIYFLVASAVLSQDPGSINIPDNKPVQYSSSSWNGSSITLAAGNLNIEKNYAGAISRR